MRNTPPLSEERTKHLGILEPAAIKHGEEEIIIRQREKIGIAVSDFQIGDNALQNIAELVVIDGVQPIHIVRCAIAQRMLGQQHDGQPLAVSIFE